STSSIKINGARQHNLKNINVDVPLGVFACVTGVSGSGKSTLIHDVLYRNLLRVKGQSVDQEVGACKSVTGAHRIGEVVMVDQSPLARTPRSTPILYLGLFDRVRELFATQPEAMAQGLTASAFSFNSGSGRCERCSGTGYEKIEMQFLSDLFVRCAECEGKRFQSHVLKVQLHGKSIHDLLKLTVSEAIAFFAQIGEDKSLSEPLGVLEEVGLGYLRLGQPLNTLSGGDVVAVGTPEQIPKAGASHTGHFLQRVFTQSRKKLHVIPSREDGEGPRKAPRELERSFAYAQDDNVEMARAAEEAPRFRVDGANGAIQVHGAREHNLKNIDVKIPREQLVVITGLSDCATGQGSKRVSHRSRALGGTSGIRHAVCGWKIGSYPAFSKIGAVQRAYDRRGR